MGLGLRLGLGREKKTSVGLGPDRRTRGLPGIARRGGAGEENKCWPWPGQTHAGVARNRKALARWPPPSTCTDDAQGVVGLSAVAPLQSPGCHASAPPMARRVARLAPPVARRVARRAPPMARRAARLATPM